MESHANRDKNTDPRSATHRGRGKKRNFERVRARKGKNEKLERVRALQYAARVLLYELVLAARECCGVWVCVGAVLA